ncbi:hypothetical protein [Mucilaginibacter sp.]|jgi:hypothetical protein|uniref:hypothetical protein n=1 Tax=Mucilaginibacter sp. TaxID=1882438 RepID=UPI00356B616C
MEGNKENRISKHLMSLLKKGSSIKDHFFIGYDLHKAGFIFDPPYISCNSNLDLLCEIAADFVKVSASRAGLSIGKDEIIAELLKLLLSVGGDDFIVILSLNKKSVIAGKVTHRKSPLFNELFDESF